MNLVIRNFIFPKMGFLIKRKEAVPDRKQPLFLGLQGVKNYSALVEPAIARAIYLSISCASVASLYSFLIFS